MRKKADPVARTPSGTPVSVDLGAESVSKILLAFPPAPTVPVHPSPPAPLQGDISAPLQGDISSDV